MNVSITYKILKKKNKESAYLERGRERERRTHKTWRAEILVSDMGIGPIKLLLLSRLSLDIHSRKTILRSIMMPQRKSYITGRRERKKKTFFEEKI